MNFLVPYIRPSGKTSVIYVHRNIIVILMHQLRAILVSNRVIDLTKKSYFKPRSSATRTVLSGLNLDQTSTHSHILIQVTKQCTELILQL